MTTINLYKDTGLGTTAKLSPYMDSDCTLDEAMAVLRTEAEYAADCLGGWIEYAGKMAFIYARKTPGHKPRIYYRLWLRVTESADVAC